MNKSLLALAVGGAFVVASGVSAQGKLQVPPSPEEQAKMQSEAKAAKAAKAKMTPEEKKAATAEKQKQLQSLMDTCTEDYRAAHATPEKAAKLRADAAAVKQAHAKMTPAEKKALSAEKQKQLQECLKSAGPAG